MDKDAYYRYGTDKAGWDYKTAPELSREVVEMMKHERVDDRYRFLWMGVGVLRMPNVYEPNPIVLGDRRACVYVPTQIGFSEPSNIISGQPGLITPRIVNWLQPKEAFTRRLIPKFWYWTDSEGKLHQAPRPEELVTPPGVVVDLFTVDMHLGHLVWQLQYRLTGDQLVAGSFYRPADAPNEYWHTIKTFRSANHGYLEPTVADVEEMIIKREYQNRHLSPMEMRELIQATALAEHQRYLAAMQAQDAANKADFDALAQEVINFSMSQAKNAGGMALVA